MTTQANAGFPDLRDALDGAPVSQARVGTYLNYRADVFSKVINGHQPPRGGVSPEQFRAKVLDAIETLTRGSEVRA